MRASVAGESDPGVWGPRLTRPWVREKCSRGGRELSGAEAPASLIDHLARQWVGARIRKLEPGELRCQPRGATHLQAASMLDEGAAKKSARGASLERNLKVH